MTFRWNIVVLFACGPWAWGSPNGVARADAADQGNPPEVRSIERSIDHCLGQLNSDVYRIRERATQKLIHIGRAAIPFMAKAADEENLEVATRAIRVLLALAQSEDNTTSVAALERLVALKNRPGAQRTAKMRLALMREAQAIQELERYGATAIQREIFSARGTQSLTEGVTHLKIDATWTGGDEGLKHIVDLRKLRELTIHGAPVTDKCLPHILAVKSLLRLELYFAKVSDEGVDRMRRAMPHLDLDSRGTLREQRAMAEIERLGGEEVRFQLYRNGDVKIPSRYERQSWTIKLGENWTGGDQGLKYVAELKTLPNLQVYGTPVTGRALPYLNQLSNLKNLQLYNTRISEVETEEFGRQNPHIEKVIWRKGGLLGVGGKSVPLGLDRKGMAITQVLEDSAAERVGLRTGDVITRFNGQPVQEIESLTAIIAKLKPGQQATVEVLRDQTKITKKVTLGGWK